MEKEKHLFVEDDVMAEKEFDLSEKIHYKRLFGEMQDLIPDDLCFVPDIKEFIRLLWDKRRYDPHKKEWVINVDEIDKLAGPDLI